ncbi:hypothetical protein YYG_05142 [Plasmodium vinckei petteri]|uniref:Uncharacterized protein n=1 Tax=Plasmodium vinckei petteri TaxID=138298 RepID=W7AEC2_PLAVN|nr:hypothetical protein YYG_05142 [Plasmodium vinckei petteri]
MSGWYIRPYEEGYEDMIKVNFIPYRECYERKQQNAHKKHRGPPPVPNMPQKQELPKKQEMPVEHKLSKINEEISNTLSEDGANMLHEDDVDTLNGDEELDVEVASYLGDRENDSEGEENGNEDDAEE